MVLGVWSMPWWAVGRHIEWVVAGRRRKAGDLIHIFLSTPNGDMMIQNHKIWSKEELPLGSLALRFNFTTKLLLSPVSTRHILSSKIQSLFLSPGMNGSDLFHMFPLQTFGLCPLIGWYMIMEGGLGSKVVGRSDVTRQISRHAIGWSLIDFWGWKVTK